MEVAMDPQYTWYEKLYLWFIEKANIFSSRIEELEEKRRKSLALPKGTIVRCSCDNCRKVNPKSGRLWELDEYESDCDQYKAFGADGVRTDDYWSNVHQKDRTWFKDGDFEVVKTV